MLIVICGMVIGVVVGIVMALTDWVDFWEGVGYAFLGLLMGTLLGLLVWLPVNAIVDCCAEKTYYTVEDTDIYALQDNFATEGSFFLGSGHIDDELKYFYVKQTDVGYTVCNVDADKSYIQYTSDRCHVVKQSYTFNSQAARLFAVPSGERYIFYIPEGSIVNTYSIDLR